MIERIRDTVYRSLRWSEKYTKTDMLYLAKGGSWLSFGQIIGAVGGLVFATAAAHLLPKETFGIYKFVLSLAGIIGAFSLTGLGTAVTRAVSQGYEKVFMEAFWSNLRWSFGIIALASFGALYYYLNENTVLATSLLMVGIFIPIKNSASFFGNFLNGKKMFRELVIFNAGITILVTGSMVGAMFFSHDPIYIVGTYLITSTLATLFFFFITLSRHAPNDRAGTDTLSYGKHLSVMGIFDMLAGQLDKILVFHFLGAAQLAIYSFAQAMPNQINAAARTIKPLMLPKLSARNIPELQKSLPKKVFYFFLILLVIIGMYIIAAPHIFSLLFPQYMDSVFYSQIFSLMVLSAAFTPLSQTLVAHAKKQQQYVITIFTGVLKTVLILALLPTFGIMGAILSILVTKMSNALLTYILFKQLT